MADAPRKVPLFGLEVSIEDYEATTRWLLAAAHARTPLLVEHLAVYNLVTAVRDPSFLKTLRDFDLITADGQPIRFAIRLLHGYRMKDRVTARELMLDLCAAAAKQGLGVYLYGDEAGTVQALRARLAERFTGLAIVGSEPSVFRPLSPEEDAALLKRIHESRAAFVFVGLGCPLQERFVRAHRGRLHAIQLCVGSAFKSLAGERRIAPRWMQSMGLEWLFRLAQDPRRLARRYLVSNIWFIGLLWRAWLRR
jgi:exopolysaccharide biosynthesis WecB/TagA/CpsF family protein